MRNHLVIHLLGQVVGVTAVGASLVRRRIHTRKASASHHGAPARTAGSRCGKSTSQLALERNAIRPHDFTGPPITLKRDILTEYRILRQRSTGKPPSGVRDLPVSTLHGVHTQLFEQGAAKRGRFWRNPLRSSMH
jgi:hypothetical protein